MKPIRKKLGLTQVQFAELLGRSRNGYAKMERAVRTLNRTFVNLIGYVVKDRQNGLREKPEREVGRV